MKLIAMTLIALACGSALAQVPARCAGKAERAVRTDGEYASRYVGESVYAHECVLADNRAAVICDVAAEKGDGAANDSYRVVLNKTCSRVFRVELTGEE